MNPLRPSFFPDSSNFALKNSSWMRWSTCALLCLIFLVTQKIHPPHLDCHPFPPTKIGCSHPLSNTLQLRTSQFYGTMFFDSVSWSFFHIFSARTLSRTLNTTALARIPIASYNLRPRPCSRQFLFFVGVKTMGIMGWWWSGDLKVVIWQTYNIYVICCIIFLTLILYDVYLKCCRIAS